MSDTESRDESYERHGSVRNHRRSKNVYRKPESRSGEYHRSGSSRKSETTSRPRSRSNIRNFHRRRSSSNTSSNRSSSHSSEEFSSRPYKSSRDQSSRCRRSKGLTSKKNSRGRSSNGRQSQRQHTSDRSRWKSHRKSFRSGNRQRDGRRDTSSFVSSDCVRQASKSTCTRSTQTESSLNEISEKRVLQKATTSHHYPQILPNLTDYAFQDPMMNQSALDGQLELLQDELISTTLLDVTPDNQNVPEAQFPSKSVASVHGNVGEKSSGANNIVFTVKLQRLTAEQLQQGGVRPQFNIKNDNPEWHSLIAEKKCKICNVRFNITHWRVLVEHYTSVHPQYEVFPSRVAPQIATLLRGTTAIHKCARRKSTRDRYEYRQICYFCNKEMEMERNKWIDHLAGHTGYFRNQFQFNDNVMAYLCDLCNYIRFNETDIENHLQNEHGADVKDKFKEVMFLHFPEPISNRAVATVAEIKNNNPEWHCLSRDNICKYCGCKGTTNHYINAHPNSETISSRVAPAVAAFLRSLKYVPICEVITEYGCFKKRYRQICHFCNESKCYRKSDWIQHMIIHTGYYPKECDGCTRKFTKYDVRHCRSCKGTINHIGHPLQLDGMDLLAFVCDLCNFVRFNKRDIEKHLRNEHDGNSGMEDYEEIVFLTFPDQPEMEQKVIKYRRRQIDYHDSVLPHGWDGNTQLID